MESRGADDVATSATVTLPSACREPHRPAVGGALLAAAAGTRRGRRRPVGAGEVLRGLHGVRVRAASAQEPRLDAAGQVGVGHRDRVAVVDPPVVEAVRQQHHRAREAVAAQVRALPGLLGVRRPPAAPRPRGRGPRSTGRAGRACTPRRPVGPTARPRDPSSGTSSRSRGSVDATPAHATRGPAGSRRAPTACRPGGSRRPGRRMASGRIPAPSIRCTRARPRAAVERRVEQRVPTPARLVLDEEPAVAVRPGADERVAAGAGAVAAGHPPVGHCAVTTTPSRSSRRTTTSALARSRPGSAPTVDRRRRCAARAAPVPPRPAASAPCPARSAGPCRRRSRCARRSASRQRTVVCSVSAVMALEGGQRCDRLRAGVAAEPRAEASCRQARRVGARRERARPGRSRSARRPDAAGRGRPRRCPAAATPRRAWESPTTLSSVSTTSARV